MSLLTTLVVLAAFLALVVMAGVVSDAPGWRRRRRRLRQVEEAARRALSGPRTYTVLPPDPVLKPVLPLDDELEPWPTTAALEAASATGGVVEWSRRDQSAAVAATSFPAFDSGGLRFVSAADASAHRACRDAAGRVCACCVPLLFPPGTAD